MRSCFLLSDFSFFFSCLTYQVVERVGSDWYLRSGNRTGDRMDCSGYWHYWRVIIAADVFREAEGKGHCCWPLGMSGTLVHVC